MMKSLLLSALLPFLAMCQGDTARNIQIMNESGRRVEVHWVHPDTGEMVLQSTPDILNGASFALNSYVTHTFQVRELAGKKSGVCEGEDQTCRIDHFTVNSNKDQSEYRMTRRTKPLATVTTHSSPQAVCDCRTHLLTTRELSPLCWAPK